MGRDVFPREADRQLIDSFLAGRKQGDFNLQANAEVRLFKGQLQYSARDRVTCAWFDTGGALVVTILSGIDYNPSVRVIGYICERLGMSECAIERETHDEVGVAEVEQGQVVETFQRTYKYFMDGREVQPGEPIVLCGPMTIGAYRANTTGVR